MNIGYEKKALEKDVPFKLIASDIGEYSLHQHNEIEVVYVLNGEQSVEAEKQIFNLKIRDILIINSFVMHRHHLEHNRDRFFVIQFRPTILVPFSNFLYGMRFMCIMISPYTPFSEKDIRTHEILEKQIVGIFEEFEKKEPGYQIFLKAEITKLAGIIFRSVLMDTCTSKATGRFGRKSGVLNSVFMYIEENYAKEITLDEAAEIARLSVYRFCHLFKDSTGMTFSEYLNLLRINKAEEYLAADKQESVTEIAYKTGFNSIQTFNRVFRKIKGCTPTEYKQKNRMNIVSDGRI